MQCPAVECRAVQVLWASAPGRLPNGVPKVIHQTWKTADVPAQWQASLNAWRALHPDWLHVLWTDQDIEAYVKAMHAKAVPLFNGLPDAIQRVDLWRYFVLHDFGGLYCDLDIMPIQSVTEALGSASGSVFLVHSANTPGHYTNALMASNTSPSARRFWASMVAHVHGWPHNRSERLWSHVRHLRIMMSTGPMALTTVARASHEAITLLPQRLWNPYDMSVAGALHEQTADGLVKILDGSSWHAADSTFISFLHMHKWHLVTLAVLCGLYYVIGAHLLRERLAVIVARLRKRRLPVA